MLDIHRGYIMSSKDYGIKISLPGHDVMSATPEQCAVHSSFPSLKSRLGNSVPHQITVNITFTESMPNGELNTVWSMGHGYNRKVAFIAFINMTNPTTSGFGEANIGATLQALVDVTDTSIRVRVKDELFDDPAFRYITSGSRMSATIFIFAEDG